MNSTGITFFNDENLNKDNELIIKEEPSFLSEVLSSLEKKEKIGADTIGSKFKDLLEAKTHDNKGNEINDNRTQLEALKLILKLKGIKVDRGINLNIFNMPNPNEKLKY